MQLVSINPYRLLIEEWPVTWTSHIYFTYLLFECLSAGTLCAVSFFFIMKAESLVMLKHTIFWYVHISAGSIFRMGTCP